MYISYIITCRYWSITKLTIVSWSLRLTPLIKFLESSENVFLQFKSGLKQGPCIPTIALYLLIFFYSRAYPPTHLAFFLPLTSCRN